METLALAVVVALIAWALWVTAARRRRSVAELRATGFSIDQSFDLGESKLVFDRTKRQLAFINWTATLNPQNDFSIPNHLQKYRAARQAHPYSDVLGFSVEQQNKRTNRAVRVSVRNEFLRSKVEYEGYYQVMLTVVPNYSLEKLLPALRATVQSELGKTIEMTDPQW